MELWCVTYGWQPATESNRNRRPAHVETSRYHSLEAALKTRPPDIWWEVTDPAGRVVVSSVGGVHRENLQSPTLCARQVLNSRFPGLYEDSGVEEESGFDLASDDDGETWRPVLLGTKNGAKTVPNPGAIAAGKVRGLTLRAVSPDDDGYGGTDLDAIVEHGSGRVRIRRSAVEIRQTSGGRYDLHLAGKPTAYALDVDSEVVQAARDLGVVVHDYRSARDPSGRKQRRSARTW